MDAQLIHFFFVGKITRGIYFHYILKLVFWPLFNLKPLQIYANILKQTRTNYLQFILWKQMQKNLLW